MRIGFGYDVHAFAEGRELRIGGVRIDYPYGLMGHSDADVLIHAICDALLGAANLRDIGYHFPDTSAEYKNIDSKILLRETMRLLREAGYELGNIDATVAAEQPKLNPHIPDMLKTLSEVMNVPVKDLSIKATTTEKLGFTGRREGIAAYVVALIK
ncbi:MAG: 2-C-methyl-D-erythritol 2,4-cyclodiphosphate synthase [Tannerella sp.]|jgi:2-C-methyl-D-erythritol 2,4-cyclodiphosphate synthase|nr:2-C-methyl-D-erythritol 2,4-cyclodiphosphate synthase [Tannerella sp.]